MKLNVVEGECYALFAFDIAMAIDLDIAEQFIDTERQRKGIRHMHPAPNYFQYQPAPLRITREPQTVVLAGVSVQAAVEIVLYDFGAVSVAYRLPLVGAWSELISYSSALYDNQDLSRDSRRRVVELTTVLSSAVHKPAVAELVEDYFIFHLLRVEPLISVEQLCTEFRTDIAGILRAEAEPLSVQEIDDVLAFRLSYGLDDLALVDWNAAFLYGNDSDDVREVLEFVNVELLEMRFLDQILDDALARSYRSLGGNRWAAFHLGTYREELAQISQLQIDSAILFEGVNNALKLVGDQYLARIYRLASQRFHLNEWDTSILRKLETLESIYEKISNQATHRRTEILEWIIIVLIAMELLMPLLKH